MEAKGEKEVIASRLEGVVISEEGPGASSAQLHRSPCEKFRCGYRRIFPLHSAPSISSIDVVGKAMFRRSRLYYLRNLRAKPPDQESRA